jgi:hypothetical protein
MRPPRVGSSVQMFRGVVVLILTVLVGTCGKSATPPTGPSGPTVQNAVPSNDPSIRGVITAIDSTNRIRVEENPSEEARSAKAVVRISADTRIIDQDGRSVARDTLSVGTAVSVWYSGPAAESYPVQATASVILKR